VVGDGGRGVGRGMKFIMLADLWGGERLRAQGEGRL